MLKHKKHFPFTKTPYAAIGKNTLLFSCLSASIFQLPAYADTPILEEIIVTSQRREESLMDVPLAIQALGAKTIQNQGIQQIQQLQFAVTGLTVNYGQGGTLSPFLRGVGNALSGQYAENSVATYIDDVPRPRMRGANELPNLQRVEVLKGPQGALYGRNATGGAINIVTMEPTDEFMGNIKVSMGEHETREVSGYINLPISEKISWNASASQRKRDGLIKNLATNASNPLLQPGKPAGFPSEGPSSDFDPERLDVQSFDTKLKFDVTDSFTLTLRGDYTEIDDTTASGWIQQNPSATAGLINAVTGQNFTASELPIGGKPGSSTYADQGGFRYLEDFGGSIKAELDLEDITITSISAYRESKEVASIDIDGSAIPVAGFTAFFNSEYFSQELRAVSNNSGPFNWIVGGTYFKDKVNDFTSGEIGAILAGLGPYTREQILAGDFPRISLPPLEGNLDVESWSVFGEVSYDLTDSVELIISGRYTEEQRDAVFPGQLNTGGIRFEADKKEDSFTPAVTLNYKLEGGGLVYGRWAKGYKSGGLNNLLNPVSLDLSGNPVGINEFDPEKITSYEIGYKNEFLENRLRFTGAIYFYDFENFQVQRVLSPQATSVVLNADKSEIYGAEFELAAQLSDSWTLTTGVNYTHGEYKDFEVNDIVNFDGSGNRMVSSPEWSAQTTLDGRVPIGDNLLLLGSLTVSYRSDQYFDPENTDPNYQDAYTVVNGRVGLSTADENLAFYIFGRNITDEVYATHGQTNVAGTVVNYGDSRIIGATLEYSF